MREHQAGVVRRDMWASVSGAIEIPCAGASAGPGRDPLLDRYCAWRGASERRYIASVYPVDLTAADAGLPPFDAFVLIAVARATFGRRILFARAIERAADRRLAIAQGLADGVDEWHAHLLVESASVRAAMVADLERRHSIGRVDPGLLGRGGSMSSPPLVRLAS